MTLPVSGALSLSDIQSEFGGSNPISLSEYYGIVFDVPFSGPLDISDFYGTTNFPTSTEIITSGRLTGSGGGFTFYVWGYDDGFGTGVMGSINDGNVSFLPGSTVRICRGESTNEPAVFRNLFLTLSGSHPRNALSELRFTQGGVTYRFEVGEVGDSSLTVTGNATESDWDLQHTVGLGHTNWNWFRATDSANKPFGTYNSPLSPTAILVAGPGA